MPSHTNSSQAALIAKSLTFANGKVAPNRLAKAPMEELLAKLGGGPHNHSHFELYRTWARGGWGMIITGNLAIDPTHLGTPFDVTVPLDESKLPEFKTALKSMADASTGRDQPDIPASQRPLVVVQLVHAGRQSMRGSGRSPLRPAMAPSDVPMRPTTLIGIFGTALDAAMWGSTVEMSLDQIEWLKNRFVTSAVLCAEAGFDGVELHGSHGYILAAFLSPKTNIRKDRYGGSAENRCRIVLEIADEIRKRVPTEFLLGVKLNSSDYVMGGLTEEDALLNVKWLAEHGGMDFVEISGGNYENPSFVMDGFDADAEKAKLAGNSASGQDPHAKTSSRTKKREAFFQSFARQCRSVLPEDARLKLILTGGLRTRNGIAQSLSSDGGAVDMACLGRPAAVYPDLPLRLTDQSIPDNDPEADTPPFKVPALSKLGGVPIKLVGAGWGTLWHSLMMAQIATGVKSPDPTTSVWGLFKSLSGAPTSQDGTASEKAYSFVIVKLGIILAAILALYQRFSG